MNKQSFSCAGRFLAAFGIAISAPTIAQETESGQTTLSYEEAGQQAALITDAYFDAYIGRDWDALELLLSEEASFEDPTATRVFGPIRSDGSAAMMERFRSGYSVITHMRFDLDRRLVSGDVGVYEGTLDWGVDIGNGSTVAAVSPMVIVITVAEGKVVKHRDYLDYSSFLAAVSASRKAE